MQEIPDWLKKLGMSEYARRFAEDRIDFSVLPELTDQHLKGLGVALGDRLKMLAAIRELGISIPASPHRAETGPNGQDTANPPLPSIPAAATPLSISAAAEAAGERRYLTVMFCDLVDSTGISARLDAEDWGDLLRDYLDAAAAVVKELGGHVARKVGDALMSLFGYPIAQENDAERAARAALGIQHAFAELNRKNARAGKPELAARIALDTGPAVIDAAGEIYGDVANIAARVQALAEPGAVVVTAQVQRQIAGLFVVEPRGTHTLKGVLEPTAVFRLVRASGGGRRSGQHQLTPLVGRDEEMALLVRRWETVRQGAGQLVLIVGEPGLGKSRLIEEFHRRLRDTPHTWVEWSCSQLLQNTPLHPIADWGRQRFGGADVSPERRLADLENTLTLVKLDPEENVPLLAPLLDIPLTNDQTVPQAPEELRRRQLAALTTWVIAGAKVQPAVLVLEDLHWADPTTLDVLSVIAERGALVPLLVLATTRPEFRPSWSMRSHHGAMALAPLGHHEVRHMIGELAAHHALSEEVIKSVAERTGGVPLFVEEVTRLLLERSEQDSIQSIPPSLQHSLMARLDRLGPAREVAQIGSVVGRGFSYSLLRTVVGMEDAPLKNALERLVEAGILLAQGLPSESYYWFKHALIQDAAYENLLKSRRRVLHRRVGEILRDHFAASSAAAPEALAYHFTRAGLADHAIEWWGKAGDHALRRSAFQEAISHLGQAIKMADHAGTNLEPRAATKAAPSSQRLKLQTSYGQAVMWSRGFSSEESQTAFARAQQLALDTGNADERFDAYYGLWLGTISRGELGLAREIAETFRREANQTRQMTEVAVAHRVLGTTCFAQGDFTEALKNLEEALRIYDPGRDREAKFRFGNDIGAVATAYLAHAKWQFGELAQARGLIEKAVARGVESAHAPTLAIVRHFKVHYHILCGDAAATLSGADALVGLSQEHGIALFLTMGAVSSAWARARLGDREAVPELRQAVMTFAQQGNKLWVPIYQALVAELEADEGGADAALRRIDEALALAQQTGEHRNDAVLHRIRGDILLKCDPAHPAPAEEAFLTSIAIAKQQKARSFELRAALALAKLYQSSDRYADARAAVAPALEGFSPTSELPEIGEAQTLLAALVS